MSAQIAPEQLPDPGVPMVLKVRLTNTRALDRTVRAIISRDGRSVEVPLLKSYLNEKDTPTFEFQITAPLVELTYQFVASDADRPSVVSPLYAVRRPCLPRLELTDTTISAESPAEQVREVFRKASALGDEIEHYEHARKHLDELQKLLGQP
ncbi:MAG: hypothetical protein EBZ48_08105 [Proteobacteria bacterium]|nr:hypothetical protein [Pseudomonadota bacterium]